MHFPSTMRHLRRPAALIATLSVLLALTACDGPAPEEQDEALARSQQAAEAAATPAPEGAVAAPPVGNCDASQVQGLVGQTFTDTLLEQAKQDAGANAVRVLKPDQPVTMEFLGERLNIEVDEKDVISDVRCG